MKKFLSCLFGLFVIMTISHYRYTRFRVSDGILSVPGTLAYDAEVQSKTSNAWTKELIVDLKDNLSDEEVLAVEKRIGHTLYAVSEFSYEPCRLMKIQLDHDDINELYRVRCLLEKDPRVDSVEPNYPLTLLPNEQSLPVQNAIQIKKSTNDPLFKYQWHMSMIHVPEAWALTQGKGVVVAVIDTGVTHKGKVVEDLVEANFIKPYNFITKTTDANDDNGHGTHVASTIAEVANNGLGGIGVAPKASIMPLKVLSRTGSGSLADVAAAILYAADNGAKVINMSLGGPYPAKVLEDAVNYAHSKGVIVVCAAGNSGPREDTVGYPAAYKNAVAVSSVDAVGELAWYSSWGPEVKIAGPGGDLRADKNKDGRPDGVLQNTIVPSDPNNMARYEMFQGTSMASPHVAGVAALVESMGIVDPNQVLRVLQSSAVKKKDAKKYGAGIVDAAAAVALATSWNLMNGLSQSCGFFPILGAK